MNKLLWDEFFWLWSTPDPDLSDVQLLRQSELFQSLQKQDGARFSYVRMRAFNRRHDP